MKIFEEIKNWISDYLTKRYIRGEIKKKFGMVGKEVTRRNNEHIEHLTVSLFNASQIIKQKYLKLIGRNLSTKTNNFLKKLSQ